MPRCGEKDEGDMGLDITAYEKVTLVRAMSVKEFNANEETQSLTDTTSGVTRCPR